MRVGVGYDSHRFSPGGKPLVVGGVRIAADVGVDAHSDGDVACHAVTDAVLGAAGAGDIGTHYPDTDAEWKDADSIALLRSTLERLGGRVVNVDATVICEEPRIGPHREAIEAALGAAVGAPVSVKASTNEGLGAIGRGEGIAAIAVALYEGAE